MSKNMYFTKHDVFKFDKNDITMHMYYDLKLCEKLKSAFDYLLTKLPVQKLKKDLSKLKWNKGKNYNWAIIQKDNVIFILRQYQSHFTIFTKVVKEDRYGTKLGCFTFNTDSDMLSDDESDARCDNEFYDLNKYIVALMDFIGEGNIHSLWNDFSFKREKYIKIKNVWNGGEYFSSIDDFIFCLEELFGKYLELFAQTDMFEKIKTIKKGEMLGTHKVLDVKTDLKDEYYHGVGLILKGTNGADSKSWQDVYSLTRWYYGSIFPEEVKKVEKQNEAFEESFKNMFGKKP